MRGRKGWATVRTQYACFQEEAFAKQFVHRKRMSLVEIFNTVYRDESIYFKPVAATEFHFPNGEGRPSVWTRPWRRIPPRHRQYAAADASVLFSIFDAISSPSDDYTPRELEEEEHQ